MSPNLIYTDKEFYGRNTEQMPLLLAEGRTPLTVAQLMERRLNVPVGVSFTYIDTYFDTGDAIIYNPKGRFKVDLDSQDLRGINPLSDITRRGDLVLPRSYDAIDAPEFNREELILGRQLTVDEAKAHPVWRTLARDQRLLDEYVVYIFKEAKHRFGYNQNMGIYLADPEQVPTVRAWYVGRLDDESNAHGNDQVGVDGSRLVGVAPKAHVSKTLEDQVEILSEGAIKFQGRTYVLVPEDKDILKQ